MSNLKGKMTFSGCLNFVNKHRNSDILDIWADILDLTPIKKRRKDDK